MCRHLTFQLPYHKICPSQRQDVRRLLSEIEAVGVIQLSKSPYASPVVVVTKKDGSLRLCIDYRKLNPCSTRDAFPLPRIEEALEALGLSPLDLTSGYWQVGWQSMSGARQHSALPWDCLRPIGCHLGFKTPHPPFRV